MQVQSIEGRKYRIRLCMMLFISATPPEVYAEILRVSRRQQPGTVAELCIIGRAWSATCSRKAV